MKILIVGYGSAGKAHHENLQNIGGVDVDVYDPMISPKQIPVKLPEYDGFIIASPSQTHLAYLNQFVSYGKPILCEKPICSDDVPPNRLEHLYQLNPRIYVAYQARYIKDLRGIKEYSFLGLFGEILEINVKFGYDIRKWHGPENPYLERIGVMLEASHELDYVFWLFDLVFHRSTLTVLREFGPKECAAVLTFKLPNDTPCTVRLNYVQPQYERSIQVIGSKHSRLVDLYPSNFAEARVSMIHEFLEVVLGGRSCNLATIPDSLNVLNVIRWARV